MFLALILSEGGLGVVSAGNPSGGLSSLLVAYGVPGGTVVAFAAGVYVSTRPLAPRLARRATGPTVRALLATAITGSVFLVTDFA